MTDQTSSPPLTLLTGATGFVGSAVARALHARGHRLRLLVRPGSDRRNLDGLPAELAEGDLRAPDSLRRAVAGCRYVLHVAADYRLWVPDPETMMQANVQGSAALLRAARDAGVERIVYCSSVAALGLHHDGSPSDETTPNTEADVVGVYKQSKFRAEQAVLALIRTESVPAVIVNPSTPIGPRDIKPTPTGRMIADAAAGKLPAYLDTGLNVVHVDDVAEGHCLALERGQVGEKYILGGDNLPLPEVLSMVDRVTGTPRRRIRLSEAPLWPLAIASEAIARITGREPLLMRDTLRMARHRMYFSSAKAERELGYRHRPAQDAITDAVGWFRANGMVPA